MSYGITAVVSEDLKYRIATQCRRLEIPQAAFLKMALVRFLEEEEKIERNLKKGPEEYGLLKLQNLQKR